MKVWMSIFVSMALVSASGVTMGQEARQDVTEYEFEDTNLIGELIGIDDGLITIRPQPRERSLIRVRTHFVPEMLKSVEQI